MTPTYSRKHKDGDLRVGWASWDRDKHTGKMCYQQRSIKYAYLKDGKISRGAPEVSFDILLEMVVLAAEQKELDDYPEQMKMAYDKLGERLKEGTHHDR